MAFQFEYYFGFIVFIFLCKDSGEPIRTALLIIQSILQ